MGIRGEVFSTRVMLPNRTYFFNVKENRLGDLYLNIVESKNKETGGFDRQSVILFADDLQEFLKGFDESLRVMEKAVREKRHGATAGREEKTYRGERPNHEEGERGNFSGERKGRPERGNFSGERKGRPERGNFSGERKGRTDSGGGGQHSPGKKFQKNFNNDRGHDHKPDGGRRGGGKRIVVRKRDKR